MGFSYDANGRMIKATKASIPDALSTYDAAGLRVAEKVNDVWRFLIYDSGGKLVAEYGGLQSTDEGGVKYVLSDWQGSTRAMVGNTGQVQSRSDYTAFGENLGTGTGLRTAAQGFGISDSLRQRYGLTQRDDATGLDHTWFRKNENQAGRWTSPDPYNGSMSLGNPQSFNRYSYVENEPTNFIDPSGLNLAYYDVSQGMTCVLNPNDGRWHCVEHINRYWYDDGGSTWDAPDPPTGGIEVGGGGGANLIATAVDHAIDILQNGCWTAQIQLGITPRDGDFANMGISFTNGWTSAYSSHDKAAESGVVASQKVNVTTVIPFLGSPVELTQSVTYNFVVKYYEEAGAAAVTYRTSDATHYGAFVRFSLGASVNQHIATQFLEATKDSECKKSAKAAGAKAN